MMGARLPSVFRGWFAELGVGPGPAAFLAGQTPGRGRS
ncbi:hypothetical protein LI90_3032 [Carbonactinospora thermoautotrophica]|uniref:Uncharacterized protein n=1 Tax=Carbonactinospora thermoautotrophica TaxID=1469144 RepID=A0A132MVZ8_9ACTN|nr:hypothetical protein LI90_3032 [Carbonactinospora thermoautotrophica]